VSQENYQVPRGEESHFHARIERKQFDASTGNRQSIPRIQKFEFKSFKATLASLKLQGYTVDILYNPTDYVKEQLEHKKAYTQKLRDDRYKAVADKQAAERETLKEELRKELEAENKLAKDTKKLQAKNSKG